MKLNLKIKSKLIITFLIVGLVPFIAIGLITLSKSSTEIQSQAFQKLEAIREIKKAQLNVIFTPSAIRFSPFHRTPWWLTR